jgi:hypothetical protein
MTDSSEAVMKVAGQRVAEVLDLAQDESIPWGPEELGAIFRHQMTAPLLVDLGALDPALAAQFQALADGSGLLLKSFGDLLGHATPPLALLQMIKDFAKRHQCHQRSFLPLPIARVLYYLTIAAALVRWRERITSLSDSDLRQGFRWAIAQAWMNEAARDLLRQADVLLPTENAPPPPP